MSESINSLECPTCSFKNAADAKFCENCGGPLVQICPSCGTENTPQAIFCKNCGAKILTSTTPERDTRLKTLHQIAPRGIQEKMREAREVIEGERKPVTILFADIVGSTTIAEKLDPEEWKEVVASAHRRVGEAIYRYEGTIAQLLGDGVLAFFGAPITHEDDPVRAVHAALDIQDSIKGYAQELAGYVDDFQMRIGINTGMVVIGDISTDMHVEYLAVGDAVNVAARLQSAAEPGKVLISEHSARLIRSHFDLKEPGEIEAKGKSEAVRVFEVEGLKAIPESARGIEGLATPLIGRERELTELQSAITSLREGRGQIVSLLGEAGIGKSRLLEEVRIQADEDRLEVSAHSPASSILWLEGRSLSYGADLSFWAITQLLLADLELSEGDPEAKIKVALRRRVDELFGEGNDDVLPFLFHLMGVRDGGGSEQVEGLDGETLKRQTLISLQKYFAQVSEEAPTVLVLEDMHWADPSTLETIEHLLELTDRAPLMICFVMRIDRDHGSWGLKLKAETDYAHRYTEIHLRRLTSEESNQLVSMLLEDVELPESILDLTMARSEGNPLYLEEIIRSLMDQEILVREDHRWRIQGEITEATIPDTLHGILLSRIDRLEEDVRSTLQMASVIGKTFLYRILEAIAEAEKQLDAHLSQLQRADLVREKARWPDLEYTFKHSMTQEAAYQSLLLERRKAFHLKVGEAIESLFPDRQDEFSGLLAHHFEAAGADEKAVAYLIQAGDKGRLGDALLEAVDYYHRALRLLTTLEDHQRAAQTWQKLGLIHQANFEFEAMHKAYEKAFELEQKARKQDVEHALGPYGPQPTKRIFRYAIRGYPGELDPGKAIAGPQGDIIDQLFAGLARFDSDTNVVPHAARSWQVFDGGTRYVFYLRDDVHWTDGTQVTAEDFAWSWIRNLTLGTYKARFLDDVVGARDYREGRNSDPKSVGICALDPLTLEVRLNVPVTYFIYMVAQSNLVPLPRKVIERYGDDWWKPEHILSNGAYQLVQYDKKGGVLKRNPYSFDEFSGNLDQIEWCVIPGEEACVREFIEGRVDAVWDIFRRTVPKEVSANEVYVPSQLFLLQYLIFFPTRPPLDDLRVRRALAYALDHESILETVFGPGNPMANGGVVPPGLPGHSPGINLRQDVELARSLLMEAGYPDGRGFPKVLMSLPPYFSRLSSERQGAYASQWRDVLGIEVEWGVRLPGAGWITGSDAHIFCAGWVADYPDPNSFLNQSAMNTLLGQVGWHNPSFNALIEEAARTPDRTKRLAMYREADRLLVQDKVIIIPASYGGVMRKGVDLGKPWVKGLGRNALGHIFYKGIMMEEEEGRNE